MTVTESEPQRRADRRSRRGGARLAAVQALYQIEVSAADPAAVIDEFRLMRMIGGEEKRERGADVDETFFTALVEGVTVRRAEIDAQLVPLLTEGWALERLESVLRAILRAGAFELIARGDIPARVVINEYVGVARAFFGGKEPGFANGVLDRLARRVRPEEFAAQAPADGGPEAR